MAHEGRGVDHPALAPAVLGALLTAVLCSLVLAGWMFDVQHLKSLTPGGVATRPWAAVVFLTLAAAVYALVRASRDRAAARWLRVIAAGASAAATMVSALSFIQYALTVNLGFDTLLFHDQVIRDGPMIPGRMAQVVAFATTMNGAGLFCAASPWSNLARLAPAFGLVSTAIGMLGLVGALFGTNTLYSAAGYASVSVPSATMIFALGLSTLALQPDSFVIAPFLSRHSGGVVGRRLLPVALVLPFAAGWLRLYGEVIGLYNGRVGLTLFACANASFYAAAVWLTARRMNRMDMVREDSDRAVRLALGDSEARYRTLAESLPQLIWTCDSKGSADYLSPQWVAYTGIPADQLLGARWTDQVHPDDLAKVAPQWQWSVISGEPFDVEIRLRRHDGVDRWFRTMAVPLRDAAGDIVRWFGSNTDIDDRKRAEAELHELTSALEQRVDERTAELKTAKEHAESADRMKTDFITTMSHELRTPLNSIIGFTGTMLSGMPGPINAAQDQQLRIIQSSGRNLLLLINDVLDVARIESGAIDYKEAEVDVLQLLRSAAVEQTALAESKGLVIRTALEIDAFILRTDERALRQIVTNLVNNAIKFTQQGTITISARKATVRGIGRYEVAVRDTGIGIAPSDLGKLFLKFSRLHDAHQSVAGGTGLGLYLCRLLASRLGMTIEVDSELGKGTSFTLCILAEPVQRASQ